MKTFTIDNDNNITAFPTPDHAEAAVGTGSQPFTSQKQLTELSSAWPPSVAAPQSFTVTVPAASVPSALAVTVNGQTLLDSTKVEDILLIITYSIG
jgi:hypothetical protein